MVSKAVSHDQNHRGSLRARRLSSLQAVVGLQENERVRLTLQSEQAAGHPFEGWVGTLPDDEAREMIRVIEDEFERVNPDEWK